LAFGWMILTLWEIKV